MTAAARVWVTRLAALTRSDTRGIRRTRGALDALGHVNAAVRRELRRQ